MLKYDEANPQFYILAMLGIDACGKIKYIFFLSI